MPRLPVAFAAGALAVSLLGVLTPCETRAQIAGTGVPGLDDELVQASLVSDARAIAPGKPFRLAVRLAPKAGWHLNWINPGDAGLAPSVAWRLPDGFSAGPYCWPLPVRVVAGPLVIFGYEGELLLIVDVRTPTEAAVGATMEFKGEVSWLACNEACVPGSASLSLRLPVAMSAETDPERLAQFESSLARCPRASLEWNVEARADSDGFIVLDIGTAGTEGILDDVFFFPYQTGVIENSAPQRLTVLNGPTGRAAYQLRVEISRMAAGLPSRLSGILVSRSGWSGGSGARALEFDVPLGRQ